MQSIDLFIIIAAVSLAAIAVFLVPVLVQLRQTLQRADTLLESLDRELLPLVTAANDTVTEVKALSIGLNEKLDKTDTFIHSMEKSGKILLTTSKAIKETATPVATEIGALSAGVKAFLFFFTRPHKSR